MARKRRIDPFRRKINKPMQKKLVGAFMIAILAFAVLVIRVTYINASKGEEYTKVVLDQQQYDSRVIPFKRGDIMDRNGTKLASSERVYNVILDVKAMLDDEEGDRAHHPGAEGVFRDRGGHGARADRGKAFQPV